jgi:very-short-patch-repair endonuclease
MGAFPSAADTKAKRGNPGVADEYMTQVVRGHSKNWHHPKAQLYQLRMKRRPTRAERRFDDILDAALKGFDLPKIKQTQVKTKRDRKPRKFKKQKIFENAKDKKAYIADFYIPALSLVIEIDGPNHDNANQIQYDQIRSSFLATRGIKVIRFKNEDTLDFKKCLQLVKLSIKERETELINRLFVMPGQKPNKIIDLSREQELKLQADFIKNKGLTIIG